jgi:hypothetical protein
MQIAPSYHFVKLQSFLFAYFCTRSSSIQIANRHRQGRGFHTDLGMTTYDPKLPKSHSRASNEGLFHHSSCNELAFLVFIRSVAISLPILPNYFTLLQLGVSATHVHDSFKVAEIKVLFLYSQAILIMNTPNLWMGWNTRGSQVAAKHIKIRPRGLNLLLTE